MCFTARGTAPMLKWPTPAQLDDAGKVAGGISVFAAFVTGGVKWVIDFRKRAEAEKRRAVQLAEEKARRDEEALRSRQMAAAEETAKQMRIHLLEAYSQGRKDVMLDLTAIRSTVEGFDAWKDEHTISDTKRFDTIEQGQRETHAALGEIKGVLTELGREVRGVSQKAGDTAKDVEWLIRERGGKQ